MAEFILSKECVWCISQGPWRTRQDSHVGVLVKPDSKVSGHVCAPVVVSVVLHEVVDVMENQAVPVQVLHSLLVTHIKQHGTVERLCAPLQDKGNFPDIWTSESGGNAPKHVCPYLLYDIKGKLESLFLQYWHQVSQEDG